MGFQTVVNNQPGVGESGDFYGTNPRAIVLAGPGEWVSPVGGLVVGNFAWADAVGGDVSQGFTAGAQVGMLRRENQAVIVDFLSPATYEVQAGFPITLFSEGDFWTKFAAGATPGQKVYADPVTGAAVAGGASAPNVATLTASLANTGVLTVTAVATGSLGVGSVIAGAGVTAGTQITGQLTGTPGGIGTYSTVPTGQTVASEAMTVAAQATPWKVNSVAANGELAKISTWG